MAFIPAVLPGGLFSGIPWLVTPGVLSLPSIILGLWDQPCGVPAAGEGHGARKTPLAMVRPAQLWFEPLV